MRTHTRILAITIAAGRAWDVADHRQRGRRAAERRAVFLERALCRYFRLGLAVAALES